MNKELEKMAYKAIDKEFTFPFIPSTEQEDETPLTFHIKPKDAATANRAMADLNEAMDVRGGKTKVNPTKMTAAELALWKRLVIKIENFQFSNSKETPKVIEDAETIGKVYLALTAATVKEVFDATEDNVILSDALKNA